jgi:hypothetical protein
LVRMQATTPSLPAVHCQASIWASTGWPPTPAPASPPLPTHVRGTLPPHPYAVAHPCRSSPVRRAV